jgi:hypothetical protein
MLDRMPDKKIYAILALCTKAMRAREKVAA